MGEGLPDDDPSRPPPVTVLGFDEAVQVLRDNETYSSSVYEGIMGVVMGRTILQMDEPEHRLHRALVSPTFRSKVLERWEGDLVQRVVDELIDDFAAEGSADLVQQLTFHFPVQVIAEILGLPRADFPGSSGGPWRSPAWPPTGTAAWPPPRRCATTSPASSRSAGPVRPTT